MPLPTRSCRYPTPLWVKRSQDKYSSAGILRPSWSVSPLTAIRGNGSVIACRARLAYDAVFAPGAKIVVSASGGYFRIHNRLRACSLARRGDSSRRGAVPLFTSLCVFGALFWVRSNQGAGPSAQELRPSNPVPRNTAKRMSFLWTSYPFCVCFLLFCEVSLPGPSFFRGRLAPLARVVFLAFAPARLSKVFQASPFFFHESGRSCPLAELFLARPPNRKINTTSSRKRETAKMEMGK